MASKVQTIFELSEDTIKTLSNHRNWTAFLKTAAWQYKYPFQDQVLIYAQRPDATACARIDVWNRQMHRWINRGSKGIALLRENGGRYGLEYVFDVSDTHNQYNRDVRLWKFNFQHTDEIIETLESTFGELKSKTSIYDAITSAAHNAVQDNKPDYLHELRYVARDSFLRGLDDVNFDHEFCAVAEASVSYMIMHRMGLEPDGIFERADFEFIRDFNTPAAMNIIGGAVSSIAEDALRNISETIRAQQKKFARKQNPVYNKNDSTETQINEERNEENDRTQLQDSRGLSASRTDSTDGNSDARQVRTDAEDISQNSQTDDVLHASDDGQAARPPQGDRQDSNGTGRTDDSSNGISGGRDGAVESDITVRVDGTYEQLSSFGGGNSNYAVGTQLNLFDMPLPSEEEQKQIIQKAESQNNGLSAFSMPQRIIDEVLKSGASHSNTILHICAQYSKNKSASENVNFLIDHYGTGGKGFEIGDKSVAVWWNEDGIRIAYGNRAINNHLGELITWDRVDARIKELLELGQYAPQDILDKTGEYELEKFSERFWFMVRDINTYTYPELDDLFKDMFTTHSFPEGTEKLRELIQSPEQLDKLIAATEILDNIYAENSNAIRASYHNLPKLFEDLKDFKNERLHFTANEYLSSTASRFITEDEIDNILIGSREYNTPKIETYLFFKEHADIKERIDRLKSRYGHGGSYRGIFSTNYEPTKGLHFRRSDIYSPFAEVKLSWKKVAQRIDKLISEGRYLDERELTVDLPKYQSNAEQTRIRNEKYDYLRNMDKLSAEEKRETLPKRIRFLIDIMEHYESKNLDDFNLGYLRNANTLTIGEAILNDETRQQMADCMKKIGLSTADVITRNCGYTFSDELNNIKVIHFDKVGAFYQIYGDEAIKAAEILQLTLTRKVNPNGNDIPMVGMPDFAIERYADKLRGEGFLLAFPTDEQQEAELLEQAKKNIKDFFMETYGREADFHNMKEVTVALADWNGYRIKVNVDLTDYSISRYIDDEHIDTIQYGSLYDMQRQVLSKLSVSDLTDFSYEQFAPYLESVRRARIQEHLAELSEGGTTDEVNQPIEEETEEEEQPQAEEETEAEEAEQTDYSYLIGMTLAIDGSLFVIERINEISESVSMRDASFEGNVGFPIFRSEKISFVLDILEQQKQAEQEQSQSEQGEKLISVREKPQPVRNTVVYPEIPMSERHNFRITDDELGYGTKGEKYAANVAAIRTLKQIESEHRLATPEEQETLSRYVGWGGLPECFEEGNSHYEELKSLLTDEEYTQARASTLNAHYTSPTVIKAMYKALENMGFKAGNILEPSCGIGNFMGLMPDSMSESKIYGIELDSITGRIAQQLYQKSSVAIQGYEETTLPDSFFDAAIGNVPFGNYKILEKKYDKHNFPIHDFFFAKTLDKVRPGGVIAFITSKGTLDKQNSAIRRYIAQRADLIGAIRLPNNAFEKNAGTRVTSDIIFLQKRDRMTDIMPDWVNLGTDEHGYAINQYFIDNPDMILGELTEESTQYGHDITCKPYDDVDLAEQLDEAIQNINAEITEYEFEDISNDETVSIPADPDVKNFSYTVVDGDIYFRENSVMNKVEMSLTAQNRVKGLIELRECVRELIEMQTQDYPDSDIKTQQAKLNRLYDAYTAKYGLINSRGNSMAFSADSSYFLLCSLEVINDNGELVRKADMFTKRTIGAHKTVDRVDTASEALAVSIGEKARIDMEYMAELSGKTEEELFSDLKGVIFLNPMHGYGDALEDKYLTADEYLSGNVRNKLQQARARAEENPDDFTVNVEALEKVQPKDLSASDITVRLGTTWIPPEYIKQFIFELLEPSPRAKSQIEVFYSKITGNWNVTGKSSDTQSVKINRTYGTHRIGALKIVEDTLNLRDVRIFDYEEQNGKRVAVLNKKETTIAQQKQQAIKSAFDNWIWKDQQRREHLTRMYNEKFNSTRTRDYDGSHIVFSGMNPEIQLRKHQKDAVARIMYGGNSLLGHVVGAGKTWTMAAAAMEMKRLGLCNKPLFVVPNHLTEQWAAEFLQLYPSANILVTTKKDFEKKNRKKFCGRIATGDYDAIIIGHSQFEKIPMSIERQRAILQQQKREIISGIAEAKEQKAEKFTIKQMERTRHSIDAKLQKLNDTTRKDDVITFEELGVDRMFVDEAHNYKNLFLYSKMRNVGGIAQTEAQKSSDMFMKCRYLDELTGGKGNIFATGTPISNSMVELYTMQRYLQYDTLEEADLVHFDAWASTYGETVTAIELAPEGSGYRTKTRFAKFFNIPELMNMFKEVADIQTADMLNLPVPEAEYHNVAVEPTDIQREMVESLAERAEHIRGGAVDPKVDNMLKITNDGRKLALDQRLINALLPDAEGTKVATCADKVFEIWRDTSDFKGTQLVFCDNSTPKKDGTFNVYDDIRNKLIVKGVPESDIAFIHDADTDVKKKELFSKVRSGEVRILLGSTAKMGAGTNVQTRLYASHDLDCPWRPSDLEQRAGRIIRQGNTNEKVHIYRYVTKDTFDSYSYQLVENKQKFISQIMTSKSPVRSADDIDETALSYAEIKALATGNPHIKEKMELDMEVSKLKLLKSSFMSEKYDLEDKVLKTYPRQIAEFTEQIQGMEKDIETVAKYPKKEEGIHTMTIDGLGYFERKTAADALLERCKRITSDAPAVIGDYRGFTLILSTDSFEVKLTMQGARSYTIELGTDALGNIQRIDNALAKIPEFKQQSEESLEVVKKQLVIAEEASKEEFPQEAELDEKIKRLAALDALLNMDKRDNSAIDMDTSDVEVPRRKEAMVR